MNWQNKLKLITSAVKWVHNEISHWVLIYLWQECASRRQNRSTKNCQVAQVNNKFFFLDAASVDPGQNAISQRSQGEKRRYAHFMICSMRITPIKHATARTINREKRLEAESHQDNTLDWRKGRSWDKTLDRRRGSWGSDVEVKVKVRMAKQIKTLGNELTDLWKLKKNQCAQSKPWSVIESGQGETGETASTQSLLRRSWLGGANKRNQRKDSQRFFWSSAALIITIVAVIVPES